MNVLTTLLQLRNASLKNITTQHSKKRPLSTFKLYKEVASNIPSCTNPCNPPPPFPHIVATTTKKKEKVKYYLVQPTLQRKCCKKYF